MKRTIRVLALSLSILAAFAAVLIVAGVLVLDWAKGRLAANGFGEVDFAVEGLSLDRLSLSDIRFGLGQEQRLERLTLLFHPTRLLRDQSLDKVLVEGADLRFISGDDGVPQLVGVSLPRTPGDKADLKMPALPVASLELKASRLNLETGLGALRIPLRGTLTQADIGTWALDAQLELRYREMHGREARGELALKGRLEQDGATKLEMALSDAEGWLPGGVDTLGAGQATVEWDGGEQFSGTGSVAVHLAGSPVMLDIRAGKTQGEAIAFALGLDTLDLDLDLATLDELVRFGVGLAGRVSLQARIEGALPVLSERWLEEASADGRLSLQIRDGPFPDLVAKATGEVALDIQADKTQGKGLAFGLNLNASDLDLAVLDKLAGFGAGLAGWVSLQTRIEGALPVLSERWSETAAADGRISLQVKDGTLPDLVAEASGAVDLDLSLSEASLLAVPASPWKVTGRLIGLDPPASFRLSDVAGHGLRLTARTDLTRQTAAGAVGFALDGLSQPKIAGTVSGRVEQVPEDGLRFDLERLRVDPTSWTHDGMQIRVRALDARLAGTASHMHGRVSTRLDVSDVTYGGERLGDRLTGGEIELEGDLTHTDKGLALAVKDCVSVQAKRLDLGAVRWLRPVDLCVRQARGRPLLRFDSAKKTWSLALTLPSHPAVLAVEGGQDPLELVGTMPQAKLSATFDPTTQVLKLVLNTRGGRLELAEQAIAVSDLRLSLRQDRATSVTLQHAIATSLASPPDFPALVLTGKAQGRLDKSMAFDLVAQGRRVPFKLSAQGKHHFGLAIGELSYQLDKIRFSPQGLQPGDLVPAVGELISEARGSLAVSGGLSWVAGVPATYLHLALQDLGFDAAGLSVRGINTRLQRAGRTVRNQLDTQEIQVDLLDIGIPLRNGLIRFHTREAPSVHIEQLCFTWGGGGIQIEPFALRFDQLAAEHPIVLTVEAIRLNPLFQLIAVDGLWGTGFLSGRVPLRILGSEIAVDQGSISTETPGLLRYRPEEKPGFFEYNSHTELLFEALRNFHYESLSVGLNGRTQDDLQLSISLAGANPDLYDGHPFKLNFNIEGELDTIIRRSLAIATFAERFGEVLSRYLK